MDYKVSNKLGDNLNTNEQVMDNSVLYPVLNSKIEFNVKEQIEQQNIQQDKTNKIQNNEIQTQNTNQFIKVNNPNLIKAGRWKIRFEKQIDQDKYLQKNAIKSMKNVLQGLLADVVYVTLMSGIEPVAAKHSVFEGISTNEKILFFLYWLPNIFHWFSFILVFSENKPVYPLQAFILGGLSVFWKILNMGFYAGPPQQMKRGSPGKAVFYWLEIVISLHVIISTYMYFKQVKISVSNQTKQTELYLEERKLDLEQDQLYEIELKDVTFQNLQQRDMSKYYKYLLGNQKSKDQQKDTKEFQDTSDSRFKTQQTGKATMEQYQYNQLVNNSVDTDHKTNSFSSNFFEKEPNNDIKIIDNLEAESQSPQNTNLQTQVNPLIKPQNNLQQTIIKQEVPKIDPPSTNTNTQNNTQGFKDAFSNTKAELYNNKNINQTVQRPQFGRNVGIQFKQPSLQVDKPQQYNNNMGSTVQSKYLNDETKSIFESYKQAKKLRHNNQ